MEKLYSLIRRNQIEHEYKTKPNVIYSKKLDIKIFASYKITKTIRNTTFVAYVYGEVVNGIDITLTIYKPTNKRKDADLILELILRTHAMAKLCATGLKSLDIDIFLLESKKYLPSNKGKIISIDNVNSGCTVIGGGENNKVYIWRIEEVKKVLVHELIHALAIDDCLVDDTAAERRLVAMFSYCPPNKKSNLFEAYVEFWANVINALFIMASRDERISALGAYLSKETEHSFKQCSKILRYYNIYEFEDIYMNNLETCRFREESSVFMYYFGKLLLLLNYKAVFQLCRAMSKGRYIVNIPSQSRRFTNQLIGIMEASLNPETIRTFNQYLRRHPRDASLRMSYFG